MNFWEKYALLEQELNSRRHFKIFVLVLMIQCLQSIWVSCFTWLLKMSFVNVSNVLSKCTCSSKRHFSFCSSQFTDFFSIWVFFHKHLQITGLQGKGEGISLTPHYHFHPLNKHLGISRSITAESSPLYIGGSRTRTGNLWFLSASS